MAPVELKGGMENRGCCRVKEAGEERRKRSEAGGWAWGRKERGERKEKRKERKGEVKVGQVAFGLDRVSFSFPFNSSSNSIFCF